MPGPPPPSKSYLLNLDDYSSSDSGEDVTDTATSLRNLSTEAPASLTDRIRDGILGQLPGLTTTYPDQDVDQIYEAEITTTDAVHDKNGAGGKKKKRKKKKKKKLAAKDTKPNKAVSFGTVEAVEFKRCLGSDTVPGDGGWPLGLEKEAVQVETDSRKLSVPIDFYEEEKQKRLALRWEKWAAVQDEPVQKPQEFTTRQLDYKYKVKNPLFRVLSEKERMHLLVSSSAPPPDQHSPPSTPEQTNNRRITRSRARSRSFAEEYNESFTQMDVHHVRNELEEIRIQRTREGHIGCNCRKLQVYLLPPGGGGKKANSRRMNFPKLKEELRKRNILPKDTKTREELELILHEAVEKESCCSSEDCFCYRNNLNCQDDACSCWWPSHQTQKTKTDHTGALATPEQIKERCKNKFGIHITDVDSIDAFRKDLLCQVIGESKKL